jgi:hypothetical protein
MEDHKNFFFIQILIEVKGEVIKSHFEVDTEARMVDIINMKVKLMEWTRKLCKTRKSKSRGSHGSRDENH